MAAALAVAAALPAQAQTNAVRGHQAGDIHLGAGLIVVAPRNGGNVGVIGGSPHASTTVTPQLDLTYFFTPQFALNLIAATSRHDISVHNSAIGRVDLGRVWALPPTLTAQFHPLPASRFSPYVGAGVNYTVFYGEGGSRTAPVTSVDVTNAFGFALNAGMNVELTPNLLFNVDVKKLFLRPDVHVETTVGRINATTRLDPWIFGASIRYRF
ncbi:MAG: OmpW family outer membrane protein [Pseudomonadota bacterium]